MKNTIIEFEPYDNTPHKVSKVVCLKCLQMWIAVRPEDVFLKDLECPNCSEKGFTIETGEVLSEEVQSGCLQN